MVGFALCLFLPWQPTSVCLHAMETKHRHHSPAAACFCMYNVALFWILNTHVDQTTGILGDFGEPQNVAVNSGKKVNFTCKTKSDSRLRWSTKLTGQNNEQILTRDGRVLPIFAVNYSTEQVNGELTLIVINASLHDAGRYICLELTTSKTSSAELIVLEAAPACNSIQGTLSSTLKCDVKYRGNWSPDMDLSIRENNAAAVQVSSEHLTRHLNISHSRCDPASVLCYACTVKFSQNAISTKTSEGENVNGVIGTVATNIPQYSATTNCINCGQRGHLATSLLAMTFVVLTSLR